MNEWVHEQPIVGREVGQWNRKQEQTCSKLINRLLPRFLIGNFKFVQWLLIFPYAGHEILRETITSMVENINSFCDTNETAKTDPKEVVLCLTGPLLFSASVHNVWVDIERQGLTPTFLIEDGIDWSGKAKWVRSISNKKTMDGVKKSYKRLQNVKYKTTPCEVD